MRRPSGVRPSSSTISNDISSEAVWPKLLIFGIKHPQEGGTENVVFCSDRIRTLVAMATYTSHRLIMEKSGNCKFLLSHWRYLSFIFREMFIELCFTFQMIFILIAYFDWLLGPQKGQIFEKIFKNLLLRNCLLYEADTLHRCSWH